MTASKVHKTQVDLSGLMRVLSEALYSTPFVVIRELVQNAHDSCTRRRIEADAQHVGRIDVYADRSGLRIVDNGAGLTEQEIHQFLATVGTGYTRRLRESGADLDADLIGYFGLGFLSAFAVSAKVEVWTCSHQQPEQAHRFISRNGETYSVEPAEPRPIGTEVRLHWRDDRIELMDTDAVRAWLRRYCCLLDLPVRFNDHERINDVPPPWRNPDVSPLRARRQALDFAALFEYRFEPITALSFADEALGLSGVFWIQNAGSFASSDQRTVSVFVRGMLISTEERELLPSWAGFVGCVLESHRLQPTASRESLSREAEYVRVQRFLRSALISALQQIARDDEASWRRILLRHNEALLGAALVDDALFALLAEVLTIPTSEGDLNMSELLKRSQQRIYVSAEEGQGVESVLQRALKRPIVSGIRFAALPFVQRYADLHATELVLLGTHQGDQRLFRTCQCAPADVATLKQLFHDPDRLVEVRAFDPSALPFAVVTNRDVQLKRRLEDDEADRRMGQAILGLARQFTSKIENGALTTLYVNAENPLIQALLRLPPERQALLQTLLLGLLDLMFQHPSSDLTASLARLSQATLTLIEA